MKISNFAVIYMIIIIPIVLVASYYISLQVNTNNLQTSYTSKQLSATRDAIAAFEFNTVELNENYSSVEKLRRRIVNASINTFTDSLANSLEISGASKQQMLAYIPAIAFTVYDGYYIYSPTETKQIIKDEDGLGVLDEDKNILYVCDTDQYTSDGVYNGEGLYNGVAYTTNSEYAKTEYSHILKPFTSYSARYVDNTTDTDIVVNYTLDNYITISGEVDGSYVKKSGYLIKNSSEPFDITQEKLKEYVWYEDLDSPMEYTYIYASDNTKVYFDGDTPFQVNDGKRTNLADVSAKYKKIVMYNGKTIYQALNSVAITSNKNIEYKGLYQDTKGTEYSGGVDVGIQQDISARNYYYEAKLFSNWVYNNDKLKKLTIRNMKINEDELKQIYGNSVNIEELYGNLDDKIFNKNEDPESDASVFVKHKRNVIKQILISNLNQAITSYSRNAEGEYQLPILSETDWDNILKNVSMVTFVQGMPIGTKDYNNYVVATSTANNEYVNPDEIYLNGNDEYYHMPYCKKLTYDSNLVGYRNTDYVIKSYTEEEETKYYYKHNINAATTRQACYYCIIQRDLFEGYDKDSDTGKAHKKAYQKALARERYVTHEFR